MTIIVTAINKKTFDWDTQNPLLQKVSKVFKKENLLTFKLRYG